MSRDGEGSNGGAPPTPPGDSDASGRDGRGVTRRQLLHLLGTSAAVAGTLTAGGLLLGRGAGAGAAGGRRAALGRIRDHRPERGVDAVRTAIVHGSDPAANARRAVEALGGMGAFVRPGEKVVIKPNVGWNRLPEQGANTTPEIVAELVREARAAGAREVWVADVSVNNPEACFERSGIRRAVGEAGGTVVLPNGGAFRTVEVGGHMLRVAEVLWPFVEADRVINVPIVKQHSLSRATLSMKNWYGVLGGHRARLHQQIEQSVVDLAAMMKPTLTVLDATRVLMRKGPSGGNLDDVKRADTVAAGVDEVALDAFGAELLGIAPGELGSLALAERAGLGRADYRAGRFVEIPG